MSNAVAFSCAVASAAFPLNSCCCFIVRRRNAKCFLPERSSQTTLKLEQQTPWLVLSSPDKPESRYLYDLVPAGGEKGIRFNRELHLPEIAGQNLIGSSQGYLLSIDGNADIHATDPLTGATLGLPPTATLPNMAGVIRHSSSGNITHYVNKKDGDEETEVQSFILEDSDGWTKSLFCLPGQSFYSFQRRHSMDNY